MSKFEIGHDKYQSGKLNAFDQLKILKRLVGPFNKVMSPELIQSITEDIKTGKEGDPLKYFTAFSDAASTISDEDLEFIIMKCCAACETHQNGAWAPILVPNSNIFAFPELSKDPGKLLRITFEVVKENLTGFFDALPSTLGMGSK